MSDETERGRGPDGEQTRRTPKRSSSGTAEAASRAETSASSGGVTRRGALKSLGTLGALGLGGGGSYLALAPDTATAEQLGDRPVSALPGTSYHEQATHEIRESDGFLDERRTLLASRGVQLTNFRVVSDEDVARPTCGASTGIEYRFSAVGVATGTRTGGLRDADHRTELPPVSDLVNATPELLSVDLDDEGCGTAAVQPHYLNALTTQSPTNWRQSVADAPLTERAARQSASDGLDASDKVGAVVGAASLLNPVRGAANRRYLDSAILRRVGDLVESGVKVWNAIRIAKKIVSVLEAPESFANSAFSRAGITIEGGRAPGVASLADFTVMVPADMAEPTTLTVSQTFDWNEASDEWGFSINTLVDSLSHRITIHPNGPDTPLEDVAVPTITTKALDVGEDGTPSAGSARAPPIEPGTPRPAVGETVSLAADESHFTLAGGSVDEYEWSVGGATSTGPTTDHAFDSAGTYGVSLSARDEIESAPNERLAATHSRSLTVGEDPHLGPLAQFDYAPRPVRAGEEVTLDASAVETPVGSVQAYDWRVRTVLDDGTYGPYEKTFSGERVTFTAAAGATHHVSLEVTDDRGLTDSERAVLDPVTRPTAVIDLSPTPVLAGQELNLDATASTANVGELASASWELFVVPGGQPERATLVAEGAGLESTVSVVQAAPYVVRLSVTDSEGETGIATAGFTATEPAIPSVNETSDAVAGPPRDLNGDGLYRDVNGNAEVDYGDTTAFFDNFESSVVENNTEAFDFNENDELDFGDVEALNEQISSH